MSVTIRKAVNGYIVSYMPEYDQVSALGAMAHHPQPSDHVFATGAEMLAFVHDSFDLADEHSASDTPEQPSYKHPESEIFNLNKDEDSTETMIESDPITPMAPLTAEAQEVWDDNLGALYEDGPFNGIAPNCQAQE